MNAVGTDVSRNKSMVAVVRPFGQIVVKPFEVRHTAIELRRLAAVLFRPHSLLLEEYGTMLP